MPIAAHINEKLGLRVHDIFGAIAPSEFAELANFYRANPHWNKADLLSLVRDDVDLSNFSSEHRTRPVKTVLRDGSDRLAAVTSTGRGNT